MLAGVRRKYQLNRVQKLFGAQQIYNRVRKQGADTKMLSFRDSEAHARIWRYIPGRGAAIGTFAVYQRKQRSHIEPAKKN